MYNILTLNAISPVGLAHLPEDQFNVTDDTATPDGVILRSYDMHTMEMPKTLLGIARAGAGTNNIPVAKCAEQGIVVFNTPGANANAVKELVLTAMLLTSRKVIQGIEWTKTLAGQEDVPKLAEKGKKAFVGPELKGKTLGVIGLGATGSRVANVAVELEMDVIGVDPFMSVDTAWRMNSAVKHAASIEEVVANSDYITMHIPYTEQTKYLFNTQLFNIMKKGARLMNFSRDELVEHQALKAAIADGTVAYYITDFPNDEVLAMDNTIVMPHIGASTPESEENCATMAAQELKDFLALGNIKNSVNYPNCSLPYTPGKARIAVANKNIPNMISSIANVFAKEGINIDNMTNKSKGDWAYNLIEAGALNGKGAELVQELEAINGVVRARIVIEA